ncbi:hypothetical protein N7448_008037 [Penicillium atrosanguineum]|uniref:Cytochrome P450 n=1 Tax=Penicillium atrosanguineum TaxID=1132637 RepID=A0A9W9QCK3_9EURO|nr:hypothetical protein N7448_008037 [Penicillium atrosanguineum]KAJ5331226.1 hypothetical protein N7476_001009 [Penicillium atrosanguineum]
MQDVKKHAQRRKLFARPFSKTAIRGSWEPVVKEKVQLAVSQIQNELETTGICDILKWSTFLATDVSGHLMFGESFNMLGVGQVYLPLSVYANATILTDNQKNEYIRILESAMKGSGIGSEIPLLRMIGPYIPLQSFREMFRTDEYLLKYSQRAVTNSRKNSESCRNIFSGLVYETERDRSVLSDMEVAIEAGNLIVAGSDTTAVTLTYLIWVVLSHPSLRLQIEEELISLGGDYDEADLESLPVLNATITETLRLYGAAPGSLPRTVPEGGVTLSGYYIPAGTTVSTQSYTIHRDPTLFPNPERFDPARWLPGDSEASEQARMALSPFGAGSRTCLGIHLSWMELRLGAAEFFRRCGNVRLAPSVSDKSMRPEHYFLIAPSAHKCEVMVGAPRKE